MAVYVVNHYFLMFDRGVVHIVVAGYIVDHYCFMFDSSYYCGWLYCCPLLFQCLTEEWFILWWLVILLPITVSCLTEEWFILLWLVILLTINV